MGNKISLFSLFMLSALNLSAQESALKLGIRLGGGVSVNNGTGKILVPEDITKKNISLKSNAEKGIKGEALLNAVFKDGDTYTVAKYNFNSGPYGNGPTPNNYI